MTTTQDNTQTFSLDALLKDGFQEGSNENTTRNIALEVIEYIKHDDGKDAVRGIDISTDQEITAILRADPNADSRENPRTELADRSNPRSNRHVAPGAVLMLERAYVQEDGLVNAGWTQAGYHKPDEGLYTTGFATMRFFEGRQGKKASVMVETIDSSTARLVDMKVDAFKAALIDQLQPSKLISSLRPNVLIRFIHTDPASGEKKAVHMGTVSLAYTRKGNEQVPMTAEETVNQLFNPTSGRKPAAIEKTLRYLAMPGAESQLQLETIRGGSIFLTRNAVSRHFNARGQILELDKQGNRSPAVAMRDLYKDPETEAQYFTDSHLAFKKSPHYEENVYFISYNRPTESRASMVTISDIPTANYNPKISDIKVVDADKAHDADSQHQVENHDDEMGINQDDMNEMEQLLAAQSRRAPM